jgi:MraZ protein
MFFGKCTLLLNEKRELILPANYRSSMGKSAYLAPGFERNLLLLPDQTFQILYSQLKLINISDPLARLFSRLFLGSAVATNIDDAGHVILPLALSEYAQLEKEIVIIGQGGYLEIWSSVQWHKQVEILNDFDANANRFEKFHVSLT